MRERGGEFGSVFFFDEELCHCGRFWGGVWMVGQQNRPVVIHFIFISIGYIFSPQRTSKPNKFTTVTVTSICTLSYIYDNKQK